MVPNSTDEIVESEDSSSLSSRPSNKSLDDSSSLSECEGAQTYLFEPYGNKFIKLGWKLRLEKLLQKPWAINVAQRWIKQDRDQSKKIKIELSQKEYWKDWSNNVKKAWYTGVSKVPIVNCILLKAFNASLGKSKLIQVRNLSK